MNLPYWIRNSYANLKSWFRPSLHNIKKSIIYLIVPLLIIAASFYFGYFLDKNNWVDRASTFLQMFAIVAGGIWGYRTFGSEKKFEGLKSLHEIVIDYDKYLGELCVAYQNKRLDLIDFRLKLMEYFNTVKLKILHTYLLHSGLKRKVLRTMNLPIFTRLDENNFVSIIQKYEKSVKAIESKIRFLLEQSY